ncbi:HEAT repeat domain-containing protein, partial [Streptomyces zhihengii]
EHPPPQTPWSSGQTPMWSDSSSRATRSRIPRALGAAAPADAVPALAETLDDPNADVRKAAVLALLRHPSTPAARTALTSATTDPDADVRAYAGRVDTG